MKKKKICFIAQFPPPMHGLSKAVDTLYRSRLKDEFDFEKVDITNNKRFIKNLIQIWKSKADLFYFTISQTKGGNLRDLIILKLLNLQKKKCLIHLHGGYYRKLVDNDLTGIQRKMNYSIMKKLKGAIVLGQSLKPVFQEMMDDEKIFVVPNCVDDEFLMSDVDFEKKMNSIQSKEVLHVLYLSNFIRSKGYLDVLEFAKIEKERVSAGAKKQFHFDFAGKFFENSEREIFESYINENELHDFITYHGIVGGKQKNDLLKQSHIFTLLSRYPNEGQPISILEAMGNGMVVVTTDHAGIPDIAKDGINGIVVKERTEKPKQTFNNLCNLKDEYQKIVETNRTECLLNYRENKYIKNLEYVFKKIID
jgi:glycosyltransferase involved in cell wall biosynthesis